jgi:putative addiction module component (TIGR02574 family)
VRQNNALPQTRHGQNEASQLNALFAIIALKDDRRENRVVSDTAIKIDGLSPEERLDLLERLGDSLARTPTDVPVTPEQRAELDRRLDDLDRDIQEGGELGVPWDEVLRQIRARG